ncbi:MAG: valine--tRNA ligase, partial [candidate division KSB1 bacterium]|nr:valine--tRNA ligase [candidate division KSB1 bacterium]
AEQGLTRHDVGREKFVELVWKWREKYGATIIEQLKKLGCSCDWSRTRFTLDPPLYRAVMEVFVRLYRKGLIYRGNYIVNWCPRCETALSDEEAIHKEHRGNLWYIRYPVKDEDGYVVVATTRPETMLGDVAVAVHPADERYKHLVGKTLILPIIEREIPIIADEQVDPEFGTGAVKVTPAHDPNDFEIGNRHGLEPIIVMNGDGTMNANAGRYAGYPRFECRKAVVEELRQKGLLEKIEEHVHAVAHCQRCDTILEPYLSEQWFVRIKPLAEPALRVVREGKIQFHPEHWVKVYTNWMENIRDWCISRQLWWGHRIPVFTCQDCGHQMVEVEKPEKCDRCGSVRLQQDEDVLDTWFSSWLWPFSTLGWPEQTEDLRYFYPTDVLVTAHDIIFFWVARMIMAGLEFMGEVPFRHVYIHGLIRDKLGRKMSKSLGNGIDPLEMVQKYSADAVRFSLMMLTSEGQDIRLAESDFEVGRNFSNKLWNAFRFLHTNYEPRHISLAAQVASQASSWKLDVADRWILSRLQYAAEKATRSIEEFHLDYMISALHGFFWHEYCDWYLEWIKPRLQGEDSGTRDRSLAIAIYVMRELLKLLHPTVPFITEEIWQHLRLPEETDLVITPWPTVPDSFRDPEAEEAMTLLQSVISSVRTIRAEMRVPPAKKAEILVRVEEDGALANLIRENRPYIEFLSGAQRVEVGPQIQKPKASASAVVSGAEIYVPLADLIDLEVERARLRKEIERLEKLLAELNRKLASQDFVMRAPEEVVERERLKKQKFETDLEKLRLNLASLD